MNNNQNNDNLTINRNFNISEIDPKLVSLLRFTTKENEKEEFKMIDKIYEEEDFENSFENDFVKDE